MPAKPAKTGRLLTYGNRGCNSPGRALARYSWNRIVGQKFFLNQCLVPAAPSNSLPSKSRMTHLAHPAPARSHLRQATADLHQAVEAAFSGLNLHNREDYGAFLMAHAAALAPLETWADEAGAVRL